MTVKLNYKTFGEGSPLIILHGLFGMLDNWQTLAKKFAENNTVYIIDQRDHGKSPHTNQFNYDLLALDLKAFCDEHNIAEANFIGHSMGGKTVMRFSQLFPSYVNKQIIVDIAPKKYTGGHELILNAILDLDLDKVESRKDADEKLSKHIGEIGTRLFLLKNLKRTDKGFEWKANFSLLNKEYKNIMSDFENAEPSTTETLFIKGGESHYINTNDEREIRELYSNVQIKTVEGAGHWVHAQKPEELLSLVRGFINKDL